MPAIWAMDARPDLLPRRCVGSSSIGLDSQPRTIRYQGAARRLKRPCCAIDALANREMKELLLSCLGQHHNSREELLCTCLPKVGRHHHLVHRYLERIWGVEHYLAILPIA